MLPASAATAHATASVGSAVATPCAPGTFNDEPAVQALWKARSKDWDVELDTTTVAPTAEGAPQRQSPSPQLKCDGVCQLSSQTHSPVTPEHVPCGPHVSTPSQRSSDT